MADIGMKYEQKATFQPFLRFFKTFHFLDRVHKPRPHTSVSWNVMEKKIQPKTGSIIIVQLTKIILICLVENAS